MKRFNACDCYISSYSNRGEEEVDISYACTLGPRKQGLCRFCFGELEPPEENTECCRCENCNCMSPDAQMDALKRALAAGLKALKEMEEAEE